MRKTNVGHVLNDYNTTDLCLLVLYTMVVVLTDNINYITTCYTFYKRIVLSYVTKNGNSVKLQA